MNAFVEISMFVFSLCLYYGGAWTCQVSHQFKISTTLLLIKQSHFLWWSPQSVFEYPDLCSSEILVSLLLSPKDCTLVKLEREQQQICQLENDFFFFFFKFIFLLAAVNLDEEPDPIIILWFCVDILFILFYTLMGMVICLSGHSWRKNARLSCW